MNLIRYRLNGTSRKMTLVIPGCWLPNPSFPSVSRTSSLEIHIADRVLDLAWTKAQNLQRFHPASIVCDMLETFLVVSFCDVSVTFGLDTTWVSHSHRASALEIPEMGKSKSVPLWNRPHDWPDHSMEDWAQFVLNSMLHKRVSC